MNYKLRVILTRLIINFVIINTTLITATYLIYNNINDPVVIALKDSLFPFKGAIMIIFFFGLIFSIINEIISYALIRQIQNKTRGNQ